MAVDGRLNFDTKIDTKGFVKGTKNISGSLGGIKSMLSKVAVAVAAAFSVKQVVSFGKASVTAANQTSNAMQGLKSILDGQGRSYSQATKWIQDYVSDGLIPLQNAVTAYKNLAARGYDDSQIQSVLTALKDSAAYGRQASYSMGEAVQTATEGLKNENSILVDNAGVTKNVAKMWEDYAKSIGTSSTKLTQAQKIQAEVNGIMTETRFQTGDAAKVASSFSGQLSRLAFNFNELKVAVGNMLTTVLQPVVTYLNTALVKITAFAKAVSQAFGITNNTALSTEALTDSTAEAANNYADMAQAAEDAQKANENSLASFDKITKLDNKDSENNSVSSVASVPSISGGAIKATAEIDTNSAAKKLKDFFKWVKSKLDKIFDPIKQAWAKTGAKVIDSIKSAFSVIKTLLSEIGKSFAEVWNNGTGQQTVEHLLSIFSNINNLIGTIAKRFTEAWGDGTGTEIVQNLWDIFNNILGTIDEITDSTVKWAEKLDFSPLLESINGLLEALKPLSENIGSGLKWFWDNVLLPVAGWVIEDAVPTFLHLLSSAISVLNSAIEALKPLGKWLWENFLEPIAEWTGGVFISVISGIADALSKISDWINEHQTTFQVMTGIVASFMAVWKGAEIIEFMYNSGGLIGILNKMKGAIAGVTIAKIKDKAETYALMGMDIADKIKKVASPLIEQIKLWGKLTAAKFKDKLESLKIIAIQAKDFAVAIAGSIKNLTLEAAAWAKSTAAKIANKVAQLAMTVATVAWNAVCTIATTVTTAFGAAVSFLTSPIGLVVLAIMALIAIGVLLYKNWDTVKEYALAAWEKIKEVFSAIGSWIYENVIEPVVNAFKAAWEAIKKVWSAVIGFFKRVWSGICNVFCSVKDWFAGVFSNAWSGIKNIFSKVGEFFGDVWSAIKKPFVAVADWFKNIFQKAWEGVKNVFSKGGKVFEGIKEGISSVFFTVVNGLIDGINWVIAKPFQAINAAIGWIKDLSIAGWEPFSGLSELDIPQIPHLATGTVVPANYGEFLAVLGDNKRETEVVSPLSTIEQAVGNAMSKYGGVGGDLVAYITIDMDGRKMHKEMVRLNKQEIRKTGNNPLVPVPV